MRQLVLWFLVALFSLGSLFPGTDVEEAFKLPALVMHYGQHLEENPADSSFLSFLGQHYGPEAGAKHAGQGHDNEHDQLPMVKHGVHLGYWLIPTMTWPMPTMAVYKVVVPQNGTLCQLQGHDPFSGLKQPPQILL